ncbi:MAG: response regulator transcription factor [Bacteroidetes bacterium]|nr:response regulator transcription factor [Bacteroidota bacterium]
MLRAIAIDDEPMALEVIRSLSAKIPFIQLSATFTNAFEALEYLRKEKPELIFLDIKMPDISGIEFLTTLSDPPMVIFTTAYSEHAVQSFELDAIDYLLKPFSQARFLKACHKANEQYELRHPLFRQQRQSPPSQQSHSSAAPPSDIFIKSGYGQVRITLTDILYVQSMGNYMQFVLPEEKILSRLTMQEAEALLPAPAFVRIHRSYLVASSKVNRIERDSIWVGEKELPIGAGYAREIARITGTK